MSPRVTMVLLALFFPPIAVGLRRGAGPSFFLCVFLTLCAFLPGVVYSLWVVWSSKGPAPRDAV